MTATENTVSEYETISVYNPLETDFTCRFNGEAFTVPAGKSVMYPRFLAFHIAKHLSSRLLAPQILKLQKALEKAAQMPFDPKITQLEQHDNPSRRIAYYDILGSKQLVEDALVGSTLLSFVGEMSEYDDYVAAKDGKKKATVESE